MIQTRVIPVLLLKKYGLYKGVKFKNYKYVGDPINAVKIFNEKEVDELVILDIHASISKKKTELEYIKSIVSEAFMPVAFGGGIWSLETAKQLFHVGIEKIIINSAAYYKDRLIHEIAKIFGSQSVVVSVDVKKGLFGKYSLYSYSGTKKEKKIIIDHVKNVEEKGAGEIIISNIGCDGLLNGYDLELVKSVSANVNIPVIANCGAGKISDFKAAKRSGATAVAAGSIFVFQGPHKAVLIKYPNCEELQSIIGA